VREVRRLFPVEWEGKVYGACQRGQRQPDGLVVPGRLTQCPKLRKAKL